MPDESSFAARQILVAIDASAASLDALAAAASIAVRLGSELKGLFVEDQDLLRLSELPFADIVRAPGGARERIDRASAEVILRALAAQARDAVKRAASSEGVPWSFQVSRGRVVREVLAAAQGADLVALGASGHGRRARGAIGQTARAAAALATRPVLVLARGVRLGGNVAAVDDGTPAGARALSAAASLSHDGGVPVIVCTTGGDVDALADVLGRVGAELAVLPAERYAQPAEVVERLLAMGIAVLLVR